MAQGGPAETRRNVSQASTIVRGAGHPDPQMLTHTASSGRKTQTRRSESTHSSTARASAHTNDGFRVEAIDASITRLRDEQRETRKEQAIAIEEMNQEREKAKTKLRYLRTEQANAITRMQEERDKTSKVLQEKRKQAVFALNETPEGYVSCNKFVHH
jgi:hypothetical protein